MNSSFSFIPTEWKHKAGITREAEQHVYSAQAYTISALPQKPG
jgi:hypothetical protein